MIPRNSSVPHQKVTKPSPCHKIHSMPLSFLPCKSPCPKTPPHARPTVPPVNRSWSTPHAACDASARCACPFPVYTKICIMLCPDASVGGLEGPEGSLSDCTTACHGTQKATPCEHNIRLGTCPPPPQQQTSRSSHTTTGISTRGGLSLARPSQPRDGASGLPRVRSPSSRSRPGEGAVDARLPLGGDLEICKPRLG